MQSFIRLTSVFFLCFFSNFLSANNLDSPLPIGLDEVYVFADLTLTIPSHVQVDVNFDKEDKKLGFKTEEEVTFVQLLKENGELEYQIPTFSKSVILDLDDLSKGDYKLNLILESEQIIPASFSKK